jgi:hypothetical protein
MSRCALERNVLSVKTLQPRRHVCGRGPRSIADGLPEMGTATAHVSVALPPGMIGARTWSDPSRDAYDIRRRDKRERQMRSAASMLRVGSCRISSASVGIYCGRLTTGLLRAQAFVERDAVTTALIRA